MLQIDDKEKAYREYVAKVYKRSSINASIVLILAFATFTYADKVIFNYPPIITNARVITICCYTLYLLASLNLLQIR